MKDKERRIYPMYPKTDLSAYRYHLIGLVDYIPIGGQGDVEHRWLYLCESEQHEPVLITEIFDVSWWAPGGPGPYGCGQSNLCEVFEEPLTSSEFSQHQSRINRVEDKEVYLPVTLCLQKLKDDEAGSSDTCQNGAAAGKAEPAKAANAPNRDTVHEVAKDETSHDKPFARLLKRILFGK